MSPTIHNELNVVIITSCLLCLGGWSLVDMVVGSCFCLCVCVILQLGFLEAHDTLSTETCNIGTT